MSRHIRIVAVTTADIYQQDCFVQQWVSATFLCLLQAHICCRVLCAINMQLCCYNTHYFALFILKRILRHCTLFNNGVMPRVFDLFILMQILRHCTMARN
jgi:hypothetical protein